METLIYGLYGLVLLVALWPTEKSGRRLLEKWKVPDPTSDQVEEAVRYLKRRRLLYPWLFVGVGWLADRRQGDFDGLLDQITVTVLVGTLLAELLALRPRRDRQRQATLAPRRLFDIASPWVLGTYFVGLDVAVVLAVLWHDWPRIVMVAVSALVVAVITWAAVVRPASGDEAVDSALRTRSVHVTAGLGIAVAGTLVGGIAGLVGILLWISMAHTTPQQKTAA